jgi:hypothetical protein
MSKTFQCQLCRGLCDATADERLLAVRLCSFHYRPDAPAGQRIRDTDAPTGFVPADAERLVLGVMRDTASGLANKDLPRKPTGLESGVAMKARLEFLDRSRILVAPGVNAVFPIDGPLLPVPEPPAEAPVLDWCRCGCGGEGNCIAGYYGGRHYTRDETNGVSAFEREGMLAVMRMPIR